MGNESWSAEGGAAPSKSNAGHKGKRLVNKKEAD